MDGAMTKQRNRSIFTRIGTAVRTMLEEAAEERVEPYVARIEAEVVSQKGLLTSMSQPGHCDLKRTTGNWR